MRRRSDVEEIFALAPATAWHAGTPRRPLVRVEPLPWSPPATWDMHERVCLALTSHGSVAFLSAAGLVRLAIADRAITGPLVAEGPLVHQNRGLIVEAFLADEDLGEYLLCIDGDMLLEPLVARKLVTAAKALELDVLSQSYPTWGGTCEASLIRVHGAARVRVEDVEEPAWGTVVRCDAVGFGCVLIRRSILLTARDDMSDTGRDWLFAPESNFPQLGEDYVACVRLASVDAKIGTGNLTRVRHIKWVPLGLRSQDAVPELGREGGP